MIESFKVWLVEQGKSSKTAKNYTSPFNGRLKPFLSILEKNIIDDIELNNNKNFKNFCHTYDDTGEIYDLNIKSKDMFRCSLLWYNRFLKRENNLIKSKKNDFLIELREYQQNGRNSISGPELWKNQPLVDVKTRLTDELDQFVNDIENSNSIRWKFLLGSPGNGKSFLLGRVYRKLISKGWTIKEDENEYLIQFCPREKLSSLWLLQDASEVRDKDTAFPNYSKDAWETILEAKEKKKSLIVCANRGVIERINFSPDIDTFNDGIPWNKLLNDKVKGFELDGIEITKVSIDHLSLFDDSNVAKAPYDSILDEILCDEKWTNCKECPNNSVCPFYANKVDLKKILETKLKIYSKVLSI